MPRGIPKKKRKISTPNPSPLAATPSFNFKNDALKVDKLDFLGEGLYILELKDGSKVEVSLDDGEKGILESLLRTGNSDEGTIQDASQNSEGLTPSALQEQSEIAFRSPLDRNQGHWQTVEPKDPSMSFYWPLETQVGSYRQVGYRLATPNDVKDYELVLGSYNPGAEQNPGSPINYMGHVLMITTKANKKAIQDSDYSQRQMNFVKRKVIDQI